MNLLLREAKRAAAVRNFARTLGMLAVLGGLVFGGVQLYHFQRQRLADIEAALEKKLSETPKTQAKPAAPAAKPKPPERPFSYLGGLRVTGAFGSVVMLSGGYTARDGQLFNKLDKAMPGVSSSFDGANLTLSGGSEKYTLSLPK